MRRQGLEHVLVAEKTRDRYPATCVYHLPFLWIGLEPFAVRGKSFQPESSDATLEPFADLTTDLAEAGPPHIKAG
jgi:hypothetical protein